MSAFHLQLTSLQPCYCCFDLMLDSFHAIFHFFWGRLGCFIVRVVLCQAPFV